MLLSVCTLIPGEPDALERIAATLANLPDELVVVCDDPPSPAFGASAQRLGAKIVAHRWRNDFSAARNAGLEAAGGDWVFWIDSDETLIAPDAAAFRGLLSRREVLGYYVTIEDIADGSSTMSPRRHRSLYRRRGEIRYTGRIHEHFEPSLEQLAANWGMTMAPSPVILRHSGYQSSTRPQKLKRNIALLQLELSDRPGRIYYLIELGRSLLLSGEPRGHAVLAEAAQVLLPRQSESEPPVPLVAALLEYVLGRAPEGFPMRSADASELAERWFPASPSLAWCRARWHYQQGDFLRAAQLLQRVLDVNESGQYDRSISFDQRIFGDETRVNLGVCYAKIGRREEAIQQFTRVQPNSPFFPMAKANLGSLKAEG